MSFYIKRNQKELGPYSDKDIKTMFKKGLLLTRDQIRHQNTKKYISIEFFFKINNINIDQNKESFKNVIGNIFKIGSLHINPFKYLNKGNSENELNYIFLWVVLTPVISLFFSSIPELTYFIYGVYFSSLWTLIIYKLISTKQNNLRETFLILLGTILISWSSITLFHRTPIWYILKENIDNGQFMLKLISMILGVGLVEETLKQIMIFRYIYVNKKITQLRTAIFYGMISGLSFGIIEGVEYQLTLNKTLDLDNNYFYNIIRLTSLPFFHAIWSGIGSYLLSLSFIDLKFKYSLRILAILLPSILHSFYNIFGISILGIFVIILSSLILTTCLTKSNYIGENLNKT